MAKIYNKPLFIFGIIIVLLTNAVFLASVVSCIYLFNLNGFDFLTLLFTILAFITDIILMIFVLKKCVIRIYILDDKVVFTNVFKGVLMIKKEEVEKIYLENMQDTPIYICIETKDGKYTSDNPFKIKYDKSYVDKIKEALKNNG